MLKNAKYFRTDIEGLRAVAILLVIGAHFAIPGMQAGFVGVDIFFVISGYLITSILLREHKETGKIALSRFYANRFRRLFPALALMLIITSFAAYNLLPNTQNLTHSLAAAASIIWLSNIFFTFSDVNYFSEDLSNNLYLHTWSLGVEEQFYLIWPLLLLAIIFVTTSKNKARTLTAFLFFIVLVSFSLNLLLTEKNPNFAFYMMPTRAWQFAIGALTWVLQDKIKLQNTAFEIAAFLLVICSLMLISSNSPYPGFLASLPTLATALLLWAGRSTSSITNRALSIPLMQWVGRISYSWYLWHWPVLILGEYLLPIKGNLNNTLFAITLSLLLAVITHYLIENPIRFGRAKRLKARWQIGITIVAMVVLNSQFLRWNTLSQIQLEASENTTYIKAINDIPFFYQDGCDDWYHSDELKPCTYGSTNAPKTAVLWGDSIGAQWFPTLTEAYSAEEWKIVVLTKSSCPIIDESYFYQRIGREYSECASWRKKATKWLQEQHITSSL